MNIGTKKDPTGKIKIAGTPLFNLLFDFYLVLAI